MKKRRVLINSAEHQMPEFTKRFDRKQLTKIAKEYIPEFIKVLPMPEYVRFLEDWVLDNFTNKGEPSPIVFGKEAAELGSNWYPIKNGRIFIAISPALNNAETVWTFFHELSHLLNFHSHHPKDTPLSIIREHERVANKFAYDKILERRLVAKKNLKKLESAYQYMQVRERFRTRRGVPPKDATLLTELEMIWLEKHPDEFVKYYPKN